MEERFRIGLASLHPRRLSGQIESLRGLAAALEDRGHIVDLLYPDRAAPSLDKQRRLPMPVRALLMLQTLRQVAAAASRVDLIQLHLPTPAFTLFADWLQQRVNVPVVVGYEAHLLPATNGIRLAYFRESPEFYLPRLVINTPWIARLSRYRCAHYVVASSYQAGELQRLGVPPERIRVIANIIDLADRIRWPRETAREELQLPAGPIITYIGHFHHVKGLDVLIRAFKHVAAALPEATLVIAWSGLGPGRKLHHLIQQTGVASRIRVLGKVDVGRLLSASDLACYPYRLTLGQQAFPNCVLEAMHLCVPLITGDLPLLREICRHGETALLVPPDNEQALAQSILQLLDDPQLRVRLQCGMQDLMQTDLHPHHLVLEYEQLYADLLERQASLLQPARCGSAV